MKMLIMIPTARNAENETIESIFAASQHEVAKAIDITFGFQKGYAVDINRTKISERAVKEEFDYVVMVDSDTVIPEDTIPKMLTVFRDYSNVGAVCGWQLYRGNVEESIAFSINDNPKYLTVKMKAKDILNQTEPFKIAGSGFGCVMIDVAVLKKFFDTKLSPFNYEYHPSGRKLGEDLYFCKHLINTIGAWLYLHPEINCGHIWSENHQLKKELEESI